MASLMALEQVLLPVNASSARNVNNIGKKRWLAAQFDENNAQLKLCNNIKYLQILFWLLVSILTKKSKKWSSYLKQYNLQWIQYKHLSWNQSKELILILFSFYCI